jgi:putative molybdopterin biosynthesis protein
MSLYLHDIPLSQAQEAFASALQAAGLAGVLASEELPLTEALVGRVLSDAVWAKLSSPHYHASGMDGFAVQASDTQTASATQPSYLRVPAQADYVDTGDPLPLWANAVIPIELVEPLSDALTQAENPRRPAQIRIRASLTPWRNVRPMGEDMVATQLVLPAGHRIRPIDLGALAGSGQTRVRVACRPRVAVLPTGSELKPIGAPLQAGDIIEYNSLILAGQVNQWGGVAVRFPITPDHFEQICQQVRTAAQDSDLILLNAGSSAGAEDFSARVVQALGTLLVHGVAVRPGHPVILGMIHLPSRPVPIIGVPGYPVSAALTAEIFVEPWLARWQGCLPAEPLQVSAQLTRKTTSHAGDDDYVRVAVGRVGENLLAAPIQRGAGVISSLVQADGLVLIPAGVQGLPAGSTVQVQLYRTPAELERTIFCIGSHDVLLDLLAQFLARRHRRLVSVNAGSQAGLVALQRGEAHLAPSHLLDPLTGEYNRAYLPRYAKLDCVLLTLVERDQGLLVRAGNPLRLNGLADLARQEVRFVNRQRGAGTRVLLDYHLAQLGLTSEQVNGYEQEEYTHLAVAAAVASGRADVGLGIPAAAQALQLDFVPLYQERYDLVIPTHYYHSELLRPLRETLHSPEFRAAVQKLPGYGIAQMGQVQA